MNISLLAVAERSAPMLDKLEEMKDAFSPEGKRIGITSRGELVVFKGSRFLMHPRQCQRAKDLMRANNLTPEGKSSLIDSFKCKELRMNRMPVADLLASLMKIKPRPDDNPSPYRHILERPVPVPVNFKPTSADMFFRRVVIQRPETDRQSGAGDGCDSVADAGYESDMSANSRASHRPAEVHTQESGMSEMRGGDDDPIRNLRFSGPPISNVGTDVEPEPAPPLPRKQNRDALIANVENARRALQDPALRQNITPAPIPRPRYHLTGSARHGCTTPGRTSSCASVRRADFATLAARGLA